MQAPRTVTLGGVRLEARPMRADEAPLVAGYFLGLGDADMERMGLVQRARLPARDAWTTALRAAIAQPDAQATAAYTTWLVDGAPVGFSSLKDLHVGHDARMHLHMWSAPHRGRGHGAALFCMTALQGFERFRLQRIVCEPRAANAMPNRMLAKAGFPLLRAYEGAASELSAVTTLNQYDVRRDVAEGYLAGLR